MKKSSYHKFLSPAHICKNKQLLLLVTPHSTLRVLTFMERCKNLPMLPSNAPALSPKTSILSSQSEDLISPLSSQVCQTYLEYRACNLHHICSTCQLPGHGAYLCQSSILQATSGNANVTPLEPSLFDNKFKSDSRYETKSASAFVNPPYHTAQAAIRLTQKKDRRTIWQRWELQSPRYQAYRRKARSKKAGTKEDVWPDDVEEAFQIGTSFIIRDLSILIHIISHPTLRQKGPNEGRVEWETSWRQRVHLGLDRETNGSSKMSETDLEPYPNPERLFG